MQAIWLVEVLLVLLKATILPVDASSDEVNFSSAPKIFTLQLNASHVVRTWQPSSAADCSWTESFPPKCSQVTNKLSAVRSKPRWLVMQLRRPMLVERVRVQSWDGEWQTAGVDGSRLSAFGAASLPLELQLEDPCRASWEAFGRFTEWRQLKGDMKFTVPFAFGYILLLNSTYTLQLSYVNLTGQWSPFSLRIEEHSSCGVKDLSYMWPGDHICFTTSCKCTGKPLNCSIMTVFNDEQKLKPVRTHTTNGISESDFYIESTEKLHGARLTCGSDPKQPPVFERVLGSVIESSHRNMTVSPVWISGHPVTVIFTTFETYPAPLHKCWIKLSDAQQINLKITKKISSVVRNNHNLTVVTVESRFTFTASLRMLHGEVVCEEEAGIGRYLDVARRVFKIAVISPPCRTHLDHGPMSRTWQEGDVMKIRVTSTNCIFWSVQHTCWVTDSLGVYRENLNKTQEFNMSSVHELTISRWMNRRDWLMNCRVNQSGIEYDIEQSRIGQGFEIASPSGTADHLRPEASSIPAAEDSRNLSPNSINSLHISIKKDHPGERTTPKDSYSLDAMPESKVSTASASHLLPLILLSVLAEILLICGVAIVAAWITWKRATHSMRQSSTGQSHQPRPNLRPFQGISHIDSGPYEYEDGDRVNDRGSSGHELGSFAVAAGQQCVAQSAPEAATYINMPNKR